jgi:hypothetical protein
MRSELKAYPRARFIMNVEYIARIAEDDYETFKTITTTSLPTEYEMWLRVRERRKSRAFNEGGATCVEIEVLPQEFSAYCMGMKRPDFSIASLDRCARAKALARGTRSPVSGC